MILNTTHILELMSADELASEIARVQAAKDGEVLFTENTWVNHDKVETIIHRSHIQYHESVGDGIVKYIKGAPTCGKKRYW